MIDQDDMNIKGLVMVVMGNTRMIGVIKGVPTGLATGIPG